MTNHTTEIWLVFSLGPDYKPKTLVGAALSQKEAGAIQDDHLKGRTEGWMGSQMFPMSTYPAAAEQLLKVTNPFPYRAELLAEGSASNRTPCHFDSLTLPV